MVVKQGFTEHIAEISAVQIAKTRNVKHLPITALRVASLGSMVSIVNRTATQNVSVANAYGRQAPVNYVPVDLRDPHVSMKHGCGWCGFLIISAVAV